MPRTRLNLLLVSSLAFAPAHALAQAQSAAPDSCETTTTLRCTGATAPLALPGGVARSTENTTASVAPPAAYPPAPYPPAPYPPAPRPSCDPTCDASRCPLCGGARALTLEESLRPAALAAGWRLGTDEHGQPVYERKVRRASPGLWVPGLVLWLGSYIGTSLGGLRDDRPWAAIPFFGALGAAGTDVLDARLGRGFGYLMGGLFQLTGFGLFIAGASGSNKLERIPIRIAPVAYQGGGGASLSARF